MRTDPHQEDQGVSQAAEEGPKRIREETRRRGAGQCLWTPRKEQQLTNMPKQEKTSNFDIYFC